MTRLLSAVRSIYRTFIGTDCVEDGSCCREEDE